jgi:hypothetical protein
VCVSVSALQKKDVCVFVLCEYVYVCVGQRVCVFVCITYFMTFYHLLSVPITSVCISQDHKDHNLLFS